MLLWFNFILGSKLFFFVLVVFLYIYNIESKRNSIGTKHNTGLQHMPVSHMNAPVMGRVQKKRE